MAKEKSLEDLEAEIARMEAELSDLGTAPPPPPKKEKKPLFGRKEAPAPEPAPEPAADPLPEAAPEPAPKKGGFLAKLKPGASQPAPAAEEAPKTSFLDRLKKKQAPPAPPPVAPSSDPAPALAPDPAPVAAPAPAEVPPPPPAPVPLAAAPPAERIPPPTGTWVQEGKTWRRVAGGPPVVSLETPLDPPAAPPPGGDAPLAYAAPPPTPPEARPEEKRRRPLFLLLVLLALLLVAALAIGAATLLKDGTTETADSTTPGGDANVTTPAGDLKAAFTISPTRATGSYSVSERIRFDAASSTIPRGATATYQWDFGDGVKSSGRSTTHPFAKVGNFTITLKITAAGTDAVVAKSIRVVPPPTAAVAVTKSTDGSLFSGDELTFSAEGSSGAGALTYTWDFGDGQKATGLVATHAYSRGGRFVAKVTVTDANGVPAEKTTTIFVGHREAINGTLPSSSDGQKVVPFFFNAAPGGLVPVRIAINITYPTAVSGVPPLGLPVAVDPTADHPRLVLRNVLGEEVANVTGDAGTVVVELAQFDAATLGVWTLEVQRPQGASTAEKTFRGMILVEVPASST